MDKLFYLLQVNDALFPIGGYSHSQGLETYIQKGLVYDEKSAGEYIIHKLKWGLARMDLLAARLAYERAAEGDVPGLMELEELLEASRIPMEQREASRKMGSRFVKTIKKMGTDLWEKGIFAEYLKARTSMPVSHCCVYGVFCAALAIDEEAVLAHYLYAQTSAMVTNCVKTIPLSQSAGQMLLKSCYECFRELLREVVTWNEEELGLSAPGFDIRGMQHERLYSRIYMS